MSQQPNTIFITGSGRSGTNILKKLLSLHTDVATLHFEYRFTIDPDGILDFYRSYPANWTPYRADKQLKRLERFLLSLAQANHQNTATPYHAWELEKWIPGYTQYVGELMESLVHFSYKGQWPGAEPGLRDDVMYYTAPVGKHEMHSAISKFLEKCFNAIREQQGKALLVEDNTHNLLYADDLLDLCPGARLIHMVRNPLDVISSLKHQRWAPSDPIQLCGWYGDLMRQWLKIAENSPQSRVIEVKFEDLVQDQKSTTDAIAAFCGLTANAEMQSLDLSQHNIGRHQHDLSQSEEAAIRERLGDLMERYGY